MGAVNVVAWEDDSDWAFTGVANNTSDSIDLTGTADEAVPTTFSGYAKVYTLPITPS